jgi:hypothetical protein
MNPIVVLREMRESIMSFMTHFSDYFVVDMTDTDRDKLVYTTTEKVRLARGCSVKLHANLRTRVVWVTPSLLFLDSSEVMQHAANTFIEKVVLWNKTNYPSCINATNTALLCLGGQIASLTEANETLWQQVTALSRRIDDIAGPIEEPITFFDDEKGKGKDKERDKEKMSVPWYEASPSSSNASSSSSKRKIDFSSEEWESL